MGRKNKKNVDRDESIDNSPMRSTNVERDDRHMSAGSHGDHSAGNEGVDDPAITRGTKNPRQQGRESTDSNSESFSGQGAQKEGGPNREGTGYTKDSNTDESDV